MRIVLDFRLLIYFAHVIGCVWWGIGYLEYSCILDYHQVNASYAAENMLPAELLVPGATELCGGGVPWIFRTDTRDLPNASLLQKYLTALYWAIATIVRNPWVAPDTGIEKVVTAIVSSAKRDVESAAAACSSAATLLMTLIDRVRASHESRSFPLPPCVLHSGRCLWHHRLRCDHR